NPGPADPGDERRVPGDAALPGRPRILWGHGAGDRDHALSPPGRRSGAESAALSPHHDRVLRVGAVFQPELRSPLYAPDAEEHGYPVFRARARGASMAKRTSNDAARVAGVSRMLSQMPQQHQRLLAMPRSAPPPGPRLELRPRTAPPGEAPRGEPRGERRR